MLDEYLRRQSIREGQRLLLFIPESGQFNFVLISLTVVTNEAIGNETIGNRRNWQQWSDNLKECSRAAAPNGKLFASKNQILSKAVGVIPFQGFKSTSTKYTTQFACFAPYEASVSNHGNQAANEFFRDGEYGQYLESFADKFDLRKWIHFGCNVHSIVPNQSESGWQLEWSVEESQRKLITQDFDAVILCTGLAAIPRTVESTVSSTFTSEE